jgi:hypothetical protein
MPSSTATIAEAQSVVAVQPIWSLVWACAAPDKASVANTAVAIHLVIVVSLWRSFQSQSDRLDRKSDLFDRLLFIDIFFDHIFYRTTKASGRRQ